MNSNFNRTFYELLRGGNIISLADSQMLKSIRKLTNHTVDLTLLEEWYAERDKIKNRANSEENKKEYEIYKIKFIK